LTWTYTLPIATDLDRVRFFTGDTVETDHLIQNEEIAYVLTLYSDVKMAAACILRALAARCSRDTNVSVGEVSVSGSNRAANWLLMAKDLDPLGITTGAAMVLPIFGGISLAEKETYEEDDDAVQPWFTRDMDNISGGPDSADD